MQLFRQLEEWTAHRDRLADATVGFVPTMGALHEGHLALIRRSAEENEHTVVSIFVNATQFNDAGDLDAYPRRLEDDAELARSAGAGLLLAPDHEAVYRDGYRYRVTENSLSRHMEGGHRPGHFDGVLTVVLKLLELVRPDRAYFGEKDYQQLLLVRGMVRAFFLPVEIVACPTVRDADGLALSSRNARLGPEARRVAATFPRVLAEAAGSDEARRRLLAAGFDVDYVVDSDGRRFGAVTVDGVRLIDNISLQQEEGSPCS
jgi:pantoate--beta-alanine ligase